MGKNIKNKPEYFLKKAEILYSKNKLKEALENYLRTIFLDRKNVKAYIGAATIYKSTGYYDKALNYLSKAETIEPDNYIILKESALCEIIRGNPENSLKYIMKAIVLNPENMDIQMQLALIHEILEEEDMALKIYQKIIETDPNYIRAYIQKATLYMHIGDYRNCAKLFRKIQKLKPDYNRSLIALGICFEKMNNITSAKRYYRKFIEKNPLTPDYFVLKYKMKELNKNNSTKKQNLYQLV